MREGEGEIAAKGPGCPHLWGKCPKDKGGHYKTSSTSLLCAAKLAREAQQGFPVSNAPNPI